MCNINSNTVMLTVNRKEDRMEQLRSKSGFICDMDGVIYHGDRLLPDAKEFIEWLKTSGKKFLFLTNSSEKTP